MNARADFPVCPLSSRRAGPRAVLSFAAHGPGALTTSVVDLNLQTNTTNTGTANRVTQQNHSHAVTGNTANSSAVSGGVGSVPSVHAYQAFNFIIRI